MKTSEIKSLQENVESLEFKEGNVRSLAMTLTKFVETQTAWEIARSIAEIHSKNFSKDQVVNYIKGINVGKTKTEKVTRSVDSAKPTLESKNSKIRRFIDEGKTVSEISKMLGLQYQRVKNVEKAYKKSLVGA